MIDDGELIVADNGYNDSGVFLNDLKGSYEPQDTAIRQYLARHEHSLLYYNTAAQTFFDAQIRSQNLWRGLRFIYSSLVTMRQNSQMIHLI